MDVVWSLARTYVHTGVAALFAWLVTDLGLKLPAEWPAADSAGWRPVGVTVSCPPWRAAPLPY